MTEQTKELVEARVPTIIATANAMIVADETTNQEAANFLNKIRETMKDVEVEILAEPEKTKKQADFAYKTLKAKFYDSLVQAKNVVSLKMSQFVQAENARRAKLQAELQAKAEKENRRSEREAKKSGAALPPVPVVAPLIPQVQANGINYRDNWSADVVDLLALVKAVSSGAAPIQCLLVNEPFLNSTARATKKEGELYPGVKCVNSKVVVGARLQ